MNKHKLSLLIAGFAAAVVIAGGWFLGVQPQLAIASANETQRQSIDSTNTSNRTELIRLQKQFAKIDAMKATLAGLQDSIPSQADTTTFVRDVDTDSTAAGTSITAITIGNAQAYVPPASTSVATGTTATATASPSPSASATAAPSAPAVPTPTAPLPHTDGSITGTNFTMIPVTVAFDAPTDAAALTLTKSIQDGARLFLVDSLSVTPQNEGSGSSWSLQGYIYVLTTTTASTSTTGETDGSSSGSSTGSTGSSTASTSSGSSASRTTANG